MNDIKKYKVSFEIEGDTMCDNVFLTKGNLKEFLLSYLDARKQGYYDNRDLDCRVSNIKIDKVKVVAKSTWKALDKFEKGIVAKELQNYH